MRKPNRRTPTTRPLADQELRSSRGGIALIQSLGVIFTLGEIAGSFALFSSTSGGSNSGEFRRDDD